jgi:hypothetical protein
MDLAKRILLAIVATPSMVFGVWLASEAGEYVGEKQSEAFSFQIKNSSWTDLMLAVCFACSVVVVMVVVFTLKGTVRSSRG